jgi:hypothetical protein
MSGVSKMEADRRALLAAGRQALFVAALLFSVASIVAGVWVISKAWVWQGCSTLSSLVAWAG